MTLREFKLREGNYFVAMEYYLLILNRTFLVLFTDQSLIGIKANGLVSAEGGGGLTTAITSLLAIHGDLENPLSYIKESYFKSIENVGLNDDGILSADEANFRINYSDIADVWYDPTKKWGMGYYPHDGKVYVKTRTQGTKEFIILGNQSGSNIARWLITPQGHAG